MYNLEYCPICGNANWCIVGKYNYNRNIVPTHSKYYKDEYLKLRHHVLFNIWYQDEQTVTLVSKYCLRCGYMCYSPRPSENDIIAKYKYLSKTEVKEALANKKEKKIVKLNYQRSLRIFNVMSRYSQLNNNSIIDIGGYDGRLLQKYLEQKYQCFLVDYYSIPINNVIRLGSTIHDIPPYQTFGHAICSHVLEHVADPIKFLKVIHNVLQDDGLLYIEVPLEIKNNIPISDDPVTHINFFTKETLCLCLIESGFNILLSKEIITTYESRHLRVTFAVAKRTEIISNTIGNEGVNSVKVALKNSLFGNIRRKLFVWSTICYDSIHIHLCSLLNKRQYKTL